MLSDGVAFVYNFLLKVKLLLTLPPINAADLDYMFKSATYKGFLLPYYSILMYWFLDSMLLKS